MTDETNSEIKYVSRAGKKLAGALDAMGVDPAGWVCADFGCNVGGFTDCLLQRGAAKVYAVDTGYGALAWTMRQHERVEVMERTNVLHCDVPEAVDLVVIDVGWTPQVKVIPVAAKWV
ncbi:MAG: TlyA family RNA methyltransferase, partial [Phycisphaerales bacterium]|nr:TlyA family RNA methyltransferase [Phycisphaerales bacterium]